MVKKCPPGVLCVENVSILLLVVILLVLGFFIYMNMMSRQKIIVNDTDNININENRRLFGFGLSWPYNNLPGSNVLLDPYAPPFRDERYLVPINVQTNIGATPVDTNYRQMGIITPLNGTAENNILPLMGRPLFTNRDKWQYYTISNQHNNVKLPISFKGRSALNDNGVDKIYDGDTVYVEGYGEPFKVTVYENDTIRYLPFV
jgi:hypothetical protein